MDNGAVARAPVSVWERGRGGRPGGGLVMDDWLGFMVASMVGSTCSQLMSYEL